MSRLLSWLLLIDDIIEKLISVITCKTQTLSQYHIVLVTTTVAVLSAYTLESKLHTVHACTNIIRL